jgi:hypothetical protein
VERYAAGWWVAAGCAGVAAAAVALAQSRLVPLLGLVALVAVLGGLTLACAPAAVGVERRRFGVGATRTAGLAVVLVAVGHHPALGLPLVAVLALGSPWVVSSVWSTFVSRG